jgi:hypothetical protein
MMNNSVENLNPKFQTTDAERLPPPQSPANAMTMSHWPEMDRAATIAEAYIREYYRRKGIKLGWVMESQADKYLIFQPEGCVLSKSELLEALMAGEHSAVAIG